MRDDSQLRDYYRPAAVVSIAVPIIVVVLALFGVGLPVKAAFGLLVLGALIFAGLMGMSMATQMEQEINLLVNQAPASVAYRETNREHTLSPNASEAQQPQPPGQHGSAPAQPSRPR